MSEALTDKQWGSDLARSALEAEFNQISVVNILVQAYSLDISICIVLRLIFQHKLVRSAPHSEWLLVLPIQGCSAGSTYWPGWELKSQSKKEEQRPLHSSIAACAHKHTNSPPTAAEAHFSPS